MTNCIGNSAVLEFPTPSQLINSITIHSRLLGAVSQLLGTKHFMLKQSELVQTLGVEPPTGTPLSSGDLPDAVSVRIFLSDYNECGGSTAIVPREGDADPAYLNDGEKLVQFRPGTVLFLKSDLWHRQTPVNSGKTRWTHNMVFARNDSEWCGQWQRSSTYFMFGNSQNLSIYDHERTRQIEEMLWEMSPFQRSVLGFPAPGSSYWNDETLEAVGKRFEIFGVDMTPYRTAFKRKNKLCKL